MIINLEELFPEGLPDETAAVIIDVLNELVIGFESQYLTQILRARRKRQTKLMDPEQPWRKKSHI